MRSAVSTFVAASATRSAVAGRTLSIAAAALIVQTQASSRADHGDRSHQDHQGMFHRIYSSGMSRRRTWRDYFRVPIVNGIEAPPYGDRRTWKQSGH